MADCAVSKTSRIICVLQSSCGGRVSVRTIQDKTGLSRRSVYRYIEAIARELPVRVANGVVVMDREMVE